MGIDPIKSRAGGQTPKGQSPASTGLILPAKHPLERSREARLRRNAAKGGVVVPAFGRLELRSVGYVYRFETEADPIRFSEVEALAERDIHIVLSRQTAIECAGRVADRK